MYEPEENLAFCSGQCQASRYPPVTCRCPCGGRNHGILRYRNPVIQIPREHVYQPSPYALTEREIPLLPNKTLELTAQTLAKELDHNRAAETRTVFPAAVHPTIPKKNKTKSFLKKITGIRSQDDLNEAVLKGLRYQFNAERVEAIIDQAFTFRQSERPHENRPELYELYETGEIDRATEFFGSRWVIGRPRIR
jgi:hypothetical protein